MRRNIDELLKQKYNEIEYNNDVTFEMMNKKKNSNLYKVASIVLLIMTIATIIVGIYQPNKEIAINDEKNKNIIIENQLLAADTIPDHQINLGLTDVASYASQSTKGIKVNYILAIRVNKILGYTNYIEKLNKYSLPVTKFEAEVLKCFKGEIEGNIDVYTLGGIISLADWEKTLREEQKEKMGYKKMTQEYKENTYVEIVNSITMEMDKPKEGKVYLVCLTEDSSAYDGLHTAGIYGMKEYNINTNSIMENGKWTNIEDIKILNDVIKYEY